jgi:UDP-N-acetylmuramyl tripeptide synthase
VLDGTVIGHCAKQHRYQEFIHLLNVIDDRTPKHLDLHLIVDNYATHKHPEVKKRLAAFIITPRCASPPTDS